MSVFIGYPSFMAYQMMKGKKGNNDGFPSIPGMIARYSALGLTNEQMATNPVWVDKTGNGHDLQMKNFAWGGMSGVGGYADNFSSESWKKPSDRSDITWTSSSFNITRVMNTGVQMYYQAAWEESESVIPEKRIIVKGLEDGQVLRYMNVGNRIIEISQDGIYTIPSFIFKGVSSYHGYSLAKKQESCDITIEQLPLYPGALVFDGVDDYGICENFPILTKEKGYTVVALRKWLTPEDKTNNEVLVANLTGEVWNAPNLGAFGCEIKYNNSDPKVVKALSFGQESKININENDLLFYQTSNSYNGVNLASGIGNGLGGSFLVVGSGGKTSLRANAAIWELITLDHDATEEELTKIKDYFVKTYPWLFPDQAWTVVGKTNEDEGRATIANITGNGNDLVLSNFGFAEGSGYGLYAYNFNSFNLRDNVVKPTDVKKDSFRIIGTGDNSSNVLVLLNESDSADWKIRITGMKEGDRCLIGNANKSGEYIIVTKDGTYTFQKQYVATSTNGIWYNSSQEVDVLVEQIPEYEGYLVTDGVDDEIISAKLIQFADKFTIVGDWKFMEDRGDNAGLLKSNQIYIYNATTGMRIYLKQGSKNYPFSCKKINALTSDGWVYDEKWDKYKVYPIGSDIDISSRLFLGFYGSNFTKIALKNLGIYNNQLLSKDDCIKAYNYLQTLKAK